MRNALTKCASLLLSSSFLISSFDSLIAQQMTDQLDIVDKEKPWSASISGGLIRSVVHPDEADFYVGAYSSITGSYRLNEATTLLGGVSANKNLNGYRENQLSSTYVGISRSLDDLLTVLSAKGINSGLSVTFDLPLNKDDVRYDRYFGSIQASPEVYYRFEDGVLSGLSISADMSFSRSFHQYTSDEGGYPLVQHSAALGLSASKPLFFDVILSASFGLSRAWDYDEVPFKTRYSASQSLSKRLTPQWTVTVGHANRSGFLFDYNGIDPNLTFYDPFNSKVYVSTSYSL